MCKALAAPPFRNSPSLCGCGVMEVESKSRNSIWPLPQASWIKHSWLLDKSRPQPYRSRLVLYTQIVPLWHKACRSLLEDAPRREVGVKQAGEWLISSRGELSAGQQKFSHLAGPSGGWVTAGAPHHITGRAEWWQPWERRPPGRLKSTMIL